MTHSLAILSFVLFSFLNAISFLVCLNQHESDERLIDDKPVSTIVFGANFDPSKHVYSQAVFSPSGKHITVWSRAAYRMSNKPEGLMQVRDSYSGEKLFQVDKFHLVEPVFIDDQTFVCSTERGVEVWNVQNKQREQLLESQNVEHLVLIDGGRKLLAVCEVPEIVLKRKQTLRMWNTDSWADAAPGLASVPPMSGCVLSLENNVVVGCFQEPRKLKAFDIKEGEELWSMDLEHKHDVWTIDGDKNELLLHEKKVIGPRRTGYSGATRLDLQSGEKVGQIALPLDFVPIGWVSTFGRHRKTRVERSGSDQWHNQANDPVFKHGDSIVVWDLAEAKIGAKYKFAEPLASRIDPKDPSGFHFLPWTKNVVGRMIPNSQEEPLEVIDLRDGNSFRPAVFGLWGSSDKFWLAINSKFNSTTLDLFSLQQFGKKQTLDHKKVQMVVFSDDNDLMASVALNELKIWKLK
jgi:hypothetical protein